MKFTCTWTQERFSRFEAREALARFIFTDYLFRGVIELLSFVAL
ncbi:unnamed protein product [Acidithrix sp. C25]|nr:unnamed protein product [Acidithrix sp. C25]